MKKVNYLSKHMNADHEAIRKVGDLALQELLLQDIVVLDK